MRTTKSKKVLSAILAICLVFGSAAALPKSTFTEAASITASAEATPSNPDTKEQTENGFVFKISDDEATIVKYNGKEANLTIPEKLGGKTVKAIGKEAFKNNTEIESVSIPSAIVKIEADAFRGDEKLAEVVLYEGITSVGNDAFANCKSLKSVLIPQSLTQIGKNAFGVSYTETSGTLQQAVDKGFTLYTYLTESPAHTYAHDTGVKFQRIAANVRFPGMNRYDTANLISASMFVNADTVVIASGTSYADALAGVPLAKVSKSPILLTSPVSISKETLAEISRLDAKKAIILGGTGAVSENVEKQLKENGVEQVERLGGKNRFATAELIANKMYELNGNKAPENLFFAYYNDYADAVSVSSAAGATGSPILFLPTKGDLNQATKDELSKIGYMEKVKKDVSNVYIIGGDGIISDEVMKNVDKNTGKASKRLGGKNRYETNLAIIKEFANGSKALDGSAIGLATAMDYPDALTGGVVGAMLKAPILLVNPKTGLSKDQIIAIKEQKNPLVENFQVITFGGRGVLSEKISREACMAIRFKDEHQGGETIKFEDSYLFKFIQTLDNSSFELEMDVSMMTLVMSDQIKKNGNNIYTKTSGTFGDTEERYTIDGKTYVLNSDKKTYYIDEDKDASKSLISIIYEDGAKYEVISSTEEDGVIIEKIRSVKEDGDEKKENTSTCSFNKETGALISIESSNGGLSMTATVKKFVTGPQEIKLPDLSEWTKTDKPEDSETE